MGCGHSSNKGGGVHDHAVRLEIDSDNGSLGNSVELLEAQRANGGSGTYEDGGELILSGAESHGNGRRARGSGAAGADTVPVRVGTDPDLADSHLAKRGGGHGNGGGRNRRAVFARPFNKSDRPGTGSGAPTRSKSPKSDDELTAILRALGKCYLFSDMSEPDRDELAAYMWREKVKVGANVLTQGRAAETFFVIERGTFEFIASAAEPNPLSPDPGAGTRASQSAVAAAAAAAVRSGSGPEPFFGENALLFQNRSPATVRCVAAQNEDGGPAGSGKSKHALLWAIDRRTFRSVFAARQEAHLGDFRAAVDAIPLLAENLTAEQRARVVGAMQVVAVREGQRVLRKGDYGEVCYFVQEGRVECSNIGDAGLGKIELGPGSHFGERALLTSERRAADVTTLTDCVLLALDRRAFDEHLGPLRSLMDEQMKGRVVEAVPILQQLPRALRDRVIGKFELVRFQDREPIVHEGDIGESFFVVRAGVVAVFSASCGDEDAAHEQQQHVANGGSIATAPSSAGSSSTGSGGVTSPASAASAAAASAAGRLRRLAGRKASSSATNGGGVRAQKRLSELYGMRLAELGEGDWFGEMALLNNEPRTATCVAVGPVECFVLRYDDFKLLRGKSALLTDTSRRRTLENRQRRESSAQASGAAQLTLRDVHKRKILGKGTFGTVYLAESSSRAAAQGVWALKMMNKAHIVECDQTRNVVNERDILLELRHPFVLRLFATFQDKDSLYMLFEFVQGGELFSVMQEHFRLPLAHAQFYAACIVDAFDYMHAVDVVYRDLKPENVLIDAQGFAKIADFGFAKRVAAGAKTYTLCGTPEYLAPETILGKGHNKGVDYWGVGVLIYEMLVGISPFADEYSDDQITVCKNVVAGKVDYNRLEAAVRETDMTPPPTMSEAQTTYVFDVRPARAPLSRHGSRHEGLERKASQHSTVSTGRRSSLNVRAAQGLIKKLLAPQPHQRLGCLRGGAVDIKRHDFFGVGSEGVEDAWAGLRSKRVAAPFVPVLSSATDTSNFDDFEPDAKWDAYSGSDDWCKDY